MKAIKKWLFDKEGLFIIITWWIILFVVFTILLGVNASNVVNNLKITEETSTTYIQEFISSGDLVLPYNSNVPSASARYDQENEEYCLQLKYNNVLEEDYNDILNLTGDAKAKAKVELKLTVIEEYFVSYNYTKNEISLDLEKKKTETLSGLSATIKTTPSGELHILWNGVDTGVSYVDGVDVIITRNDENLVINGVETGISFYPESSQVSYNEVNDNDPAKVVNTSIIVNYELGSKTFTKTTYNDENLTDVEKTIFADSVVYFTGILEESIGISKNAFTLTIVSLVVDSLLLIGGIVSVVLLKRSKED